jgi:hypothetical protein
MKPCRKNSRANRHHRTITMRHPVQVVMDTATEGMVDKVVGLEEAGTEAEAEVVGLVDEEAGGDWINIGDLKKRSSMELELWSRRPGVS